MKLLKHVSLRTRIDWSYLKKLVGPGPRRRRISPANVAELDPIELLALAVGHPIADDHRRRPVVFGHLAPARDGRTRRQAAAA